MSPCLLGHTHTLFGGRYSERARGLRTSTCAPMLGASAEGTDPADGLASSVAPVPDDAREPAQVLAEKLQAQFRALQLGRETRRETDPYLRAAVRNRDLELGRTTREPTVRIGTQPRVETDTVMETCMMLKVRALNKKLPATMEFGDGTGDRFPAASGLSEGSTWISACRKVDIRRTEEWLRGGEMSFKIESLLTIDELRPNLSAYADPLGPNPLLVFPGTSSTLLSYEPQNGGHLARFSSSFNRDGVTFFPESKRSLCLWVETAGVQVDIRVPAKRLFQAFDRASTSERFMRAGSRMRATMVPFERSRRS